MIKFRLYYDIDKEEKWLNNLVKKGYSFEKMILGFYYFKKCDSGKYIYRIDLKSKENYPVTNQKASEYISFIESTGAKLVCTWSYYAYFRQESKKGNFEIYSDKESKIEYYKRIRKLFISLCFIEMFCSSIEWFCFFNVKAIMFMFLGIFLTTLTVLFFYQASKCNKKINQLNNEL